MLQDPVDGEPAVLVKLYNVTQQKQMEAELQTQKEALARSDAQLSVCVCVFVCLCVHVCMFIGMSQKQLLSDIFTAVQHFNLLAIIYRLFLAQHGQQGQNILLTVIQRRRNVVCRFVLEMLLSLHVC